jgi:uncharacterized protein YggE
MKYKEGGIAVLIILFLALFFLPIRNIEWGKIRWLSPEIVTVTGEATSVQKNQIASFTAGVDAVNDNKDTAVNEVNTKVAALIKAVKDFGVANADIKTQNLSINQEETVYMDNGVQKTKKGQWRVNNSIEITLRNVDKASDLATLLASSGATNVYGPNFSMDNTNKAETDLFTGAMTNAKEKATALAKASDRKLGKVVSVVEGSSGTNYPIIMNAKAALSSGVPTEPGSQTVNQSLTVVFELN